MSLPNIPNITPVISLDRCETLNLLLSSIAMEEIALSHILNAEGEKLQLFLKTCPKHLDDFLLINESINKTLRTIVRSQLLLEMKLEDAADLAKKSDCFPHRCYDDRKKCKKTPCKESTHPCKEKECKGCMYCGKKTLH
ncbi:hypothetical protein [Jeotgalibacillus proteolyticus]|uniref:Uncharacterized protein n=1 Tax=Jeotgalibacillus proteolyticus TaxID=2082395 RepID=A0A2S5G7H1_9BACL|nr:hypothetical protein [Jeotgalibacillus proteolyticus]PPA68929.1 hypothetical protein C4B60_18625 [Jeotgalibacillus proteolyticus]